MKHELSLFENAIDSLNESLELYRNADKKGVRSYKFAVLNICHFVELLFKYFAWKLEPEKIFFKTKKGDKKSIGLWECLKILSSHHNQIESVFKNDLEWIKKLRNEIEHYQFSFDVEELKLFTGKVLSSTLRFCEEYQDLELIWHVDDNLQGVIISLCQNYEDKLSVSLSIVKQQEDSDYADCMSSGGAETYWRKYDCPECSHPTLVTNSESETGYKCVFCGNIESDQLEYTCDSCSNIWPRSELSYFDYTDEGHYRHMCPVCLHHPDYDGDS